MNTYVTIDGRELSLGALNDILARTCLALHGLRQLIGDTLDASELGEKECGRLTLAHLALAAITSQTENLIPDWLGIAGPGSAGS